MDKGLWEKAGCENSRFFDEDDLAAWFDIFMAAYYNDF